MKKLFLLLVIPAFVVSCSYKNTYQTEPHRSGAHKHMSSQKKVVVIKKDTKSQQFKSAKKVTNKNSFRR